jgi:TRAP-type C4-dicarboxylate transport system permease small subunit
MLHHFETGYVRLNQALIGLMMAVMFVLVFTNVVTRYGLGFSIAWAEEVASFLMIWVTFLGAGLALREGRHVAIDVLQDRLAERARRGLRLVLALVILAFLALLTWLGVQFVVFGWRSVTFVTQLPRGIPYLAVPIGCAMFALHLLLILRRFVARDWDDVHQDDGDVADARV